MLSFSLLFSILTLPIYLIWITIKHFALGNVYQNKTISASFRRVINCGVLHHLSKGATVSDVKIIANDLVSNLLDKLKSDYTDLPNYGTVYSDGLTKSTWLVLTKRTNDDPIIVYLHGGAFAFPLKGDAVEALANLYRSLLKFHKKEVSILLVDYSLTHTGAKFPKQYDEVVSIYEQLVSDGNTNISIFGNSAGGTLALNLAQYLHANDTKVWPRGLLALSPWLDTYPNIMPKAAYFKHKDLDVYSYQKLKVFSSAYVDKKYASSPHVNIQANFDKKWLTNPLITQGTILVLLGEHEIFSVEIKRFLSKAGYNKEYPDRIIVEPKGVHNGWFISETVDYSSLEEWSEMYSSSRIISYFNEILD